MGSFLFPLLSLFVLISGPGSPVGRRGAHHCALRRAPAPSPACGSLCAWGCRGRGGGGRWPWLEDTPVLAAALPAVFLSQRTRCPDSAEEEMEGITDPVAVPEIRDVRRVGLLHRSCSCSCSPVFPVFPVSRAVHTHLPAPALPGPSLPFSRCLLRGPEHFWAEK